MIVAVASRPLLSASILAADLANLADSIREAEAGGSDWIHIDVMDGRFVPNLTMGPVVVEACRRTTRLPLDVHLMVERPEALLPAFAEAGADLLTVHIETCPRLDDTLRAIHDLGLQAGVAVNPETPAEAVVPAMSSADVVLVMSVHPGFSGQKFLPEVLGKLRRLRQSRPARAEKPLFEIDGGINAATGRMAAEAGAEVFAAAKAIFGHPRGVRAGAVELRAALEPAPA
jgi:ribulose-phosphate 3-epimerase